MEKHVIGEWRAITPMLSTPDEAGLNTPITGFANCHPVLLAGRCKFTVQHVVRSRKQIALRDHWAPAPLELLAYAVRHLELGERKCPDERLLLRRDGGQRER